MKVQIPAGFVLIDTKAMNDCLYRFINEIREDFFDNSSFLTPHFSFRRSDSDCIGRDTSC